MLNGLLTGVGLRDRIGLLGKRRGSRSKERTSCLDNRDRWINILSTAHRRKIKADSNHDIERQGSYVVVGRKSLTKLPSSKIPVMCILTSWIRESELLEV